jgi:hypothetical protein
MMEREAMSCQEHYQRSIKATKIMLGSLLIVAGVLLTLANLGYMEMETLTRLWPVMLIAYGLAHLLMPSRHRSLVRGLGWLGIGAVLQAQQLGLLQIDLVELWPLVLVAVSTGLLSRAGNRSRWTDSCNTAR